MLGRKNTGRSPLVHVVFSIQSYILIPKIMAYASHSSPHRKVTAKGERQAANASSSSPSISLVTFSRCLLATKPTYCNCKALNQAGRGGKKTVLTSSCFANVFADPHVKKENLAPTHSCLPAS